MISKDGTPFNSVINNLTDFCHGLITFNLSQFISRRLEGGLKVNHKCSENVALPGFFLRLLSMVATHDAHVIPLTFKNALQTFASLIEWLLFCRCI